MNGIDFMEHTVNNTDFHEYIDESDPLFGSMDSEYHISQKLCLK